MTALVIDRSLRSRLDEYARFLRRPVQEITTDAIRAQLDKLADAKLDAEIAVFQRLWPQLREHYDQQFVAIHAGQVVDNDLEFEPLFLRVRQRFGELVVLIRQVNETPDEVFRVLS